MKKKKKSQFFLKGIHQSSFLNNSLNNGGSVMKRTDKIKDLRQILNRRSENHKNTYQERLRNDIPDSRDFQGQRMGLLDDMPDRRDFHGGPMGLLGDMSYSRDFQGQRMGLLGDMPDRRDFNGEPMGLLGDMSYSRDFHGEPMGLFGDMSYSRDFHGEPMGLLGDRPLATRGFQGGYTTRRHDNQSFHEQNLDRRENRQVFLRERLDRSEERKDFQRKRVHREEESHSFRREHSGSYQSEDNRGYQRERRDQRLGRLGSEKRLDRKECSPGRFTDKRRSVQERFEDSRQGRRNVQGDSKHNKEKNGEANYLSRRNRNETFSSVEHPGRKSKEAKLRNKRQAETSEEPHHVKRRRMTAENSQRPIQVLKTPKCSQLEALLEKEPHELLLTVSDQHSGLMAALHNCGNERHDISLKHIPVIWNVLAKAVSCANSDEALNRFLKTMLSTPFFTTHLPHVVMQLMEMMISKRWPSDVGLGCLRHLIEVMLACFHRMPNFAFDKVHCVIQSLQTLVAQIDKEDGIEMDLATRATYEQLLDAHKNIFEGRLSEWKPKDKATTSTKPAPQSFRDFPVAPTKDDLDRSPDQLFLRANIVEGKFESVDDYLDIQFRLMREDFISPLRRGVNALRSVEVQLRRKKFISQVYEYRKTLVQYPICLETGIAYVVSFDGSRYRKSWEHNKRLKFGSLLCFFTQDFSRVLFATVVNRDAKVLAERSQITVKFLSENIADEELSPEFIMVESSAFFEAYNHVLARLRALTAETFPFTEHIVLCNKEVQAPAYILRNDGYQYDFKCILSKEYDKVEIMLNNPLDLVHWPTKEMLGLDESQHEALKNAMIRRIALIQGPPGTGKTFIGLKITRLLLENVVIPQLISGPILVVCYTNHALDQFLEGIASFPDTKIARVGGRCQSDNLKPFRLAELKRVFFNNRYIPADLRKNLMVTKKSIQDLESKIIKFSARLHATGEHVLNFHVLEPFIRRELWQSIGADSQHKMKEWLLGISDNEFDSPPETEAALFKHVSDFIDEVVHEQCENIVRKFDLEKGEFDNESDDDDVEVRNAQANLAELEDEAFLEEKRRYLDDNDRLFDKDEDYFKETVSKLVGTEFINLAIHELQIPDEREKKGSLKRKGTALRKITRKELKSEDCMSKEEEDMVVFPLHLRLQQKWRLYRLWRQRYRQFLKTDMAAMLEEYNAECRVLQELRAHVDRVVMSAQHVIAMTTTGAARYGNMLNILQPKIVILEEAAEVFESHVIAALSRGCEHLIMIGDHKQLKPSPNAFAMAKRYNLDVSLFERLVRNGFQHNTLKTQHRMRPEISRLLRQECLYPELEDHQSVTNRPPIKGVVRNLFFIDHMEEESRDKHLKSYRNRFEASYVVRLCRHFLMQGYQPENITVLTLYTGQLFELKKHFARKWNYCRSPRVTVVDNYQGEENDIIILSLIRSNDEQKIGFVGVNNRICVAISRAREGFFVLGNFALFRRASPLWANILDLVEEAGGVGRELELRCQLHPDTTATASCAEDFDQVSPEGGCLKPCSKRLECGHVCVKPCHPTDRNHEGYKCRKPCSKACRRGSHLCDKLCFQRCGDCKIPVEVLIKKCGHRIDAPCFRAEDSELLCNKPCNYRLSCKHLCRETCGEEHSHDATSCKVMVTKRAPFCKHWVKVECGSHPTAEMCRHPCNAQLACGHQCSGTCSDCCEGRLHIACRVKCQRPLVCGHICSYPCGSGCPPCREKCQLSCGHAPCELPCGTPCIKCCEPCDNQCPHRACSQLCHQRCDSAPCDQPCRRRFRCPKCEKMTRCPGLCGEKCIELCRSCDAEELTEIFFGSEDDAEARFLRLQTCGHVFEVTGLDQWLRGDASGSIGVKQCPKCKTAITMTSCLRYMDEVRRNIADLENVKRKMDADADEETWKARKYKLQQDAKLLSCDNLMLISKSTVFRDIFHKRIAEAQFMRDVMNWENILTLLMRLEKWCKKFYDYPKRNVIYGMSDEYHLYTQHFLFGLLRTFLRVEMTAATLEQCSFETLRFVDMLSILQLICASFNKPSQLDASMTLWQECIPNGQQGAATYTAEKHEIILIQIKDLQKKLGRTLWINEEERVQILKAMQLNQGHWFKCPNGHIYAIGECGGAMEAAKCPECEETIGGTSHTLAMGNSLASEMDGARAAAWSNEGNMELGHLHVFD